MTCECCQFDPIVKALAAILKTYSTLQKDETSSRRSAVQKEIDPIQAKINRESSKRRPKKQVITPLKKFHPKFLQLVKLVKELTCSPDGTSLSLPQQICLACSQTSNDDNLSNSGQTFVSIDAMVSAQGISQSSPSPADIASDPSDSQNDSVPDSQQEPPDPFFSSDPSDDESPLESERPLQTAHDYLAQNTLLNPSSSDPEPSSLLPSHIHDLLIKYLNDFRDLSTYEQMLILHQWSGQTFSDFGTFKWLPKEFEKPQSKQLVSQHWAKLVAKFPLAAALRGAKCLKPVSNSLSQHYSEDNENQMEFKLEIPSKP